MKKELFGISLILFGILLNLMQLNQTWLPIFSFDFDFPGFIFGLVGVIIVFKNYFDSV